MSIGNWKIYKLISVVLIAIVISMICLSCGKKSLKPSEEILDVDTLAGCEQTVDVSNLPEGFCYVIDSISDVVMEIRYSSDANFVGRRIDGYEAPEAILSVAATSALKKVADELRNKGYRLKIYDAYRPQRAVDHFVRWSQDPSDTIMKHIYYPDIPKSKIFSRGFVATKSSHSRGSAIDLTIVNTNTGLDLDMGGSFDFFGDVSHTDYEGISDEQHQNRIFLRSVMMKYGFKSVRGEWWHFSLLNEPFPDTYFDFAVCEKQ